MSNHEVLGILHDLAMKETLLDLNFDTGNQPLKAGNYREKEHEMNDVMLGLNHDLRNFER